MLKQKIKDIIKKFPISCSFIISSTKYNESIKESLDFYLPLLQSFKNKEKEAKPTIV